MDSSIHDVLTDLEEKLNQAIDNYDFSTRKSTKHYLTVVAEYNDALTSAIIYGHFGKFDILSPVLINNRIISHVKYFYSSEFFNIIDSIIKSNPDKLQGNYDLQSIPYVSLSGNTSYEYSVKSLQDITKIDVESRGELMNVLINLADKSTLVDIKNAYNLKYILVRSCASSQVNFMDDVNDLEINKSVITVDYRNILDQSNIINNSLLTFIEDVKMFDENATPENYEIDKVGLVPSSVYFHKDQYDDNDVESFSEIYGYISDNIIDHSDDKEWIEKNKATVEEAAKQLNIGIRSTIFKFALLTGRVSYEEYDIMLLRFERILNDIEVYTKANLAIGNTVEIEWDSSEEIISRLKDSHWDDVE